MSRHTDKTRTPRPDTAPSAETALRDVAETTLALCATVEEETEALRRSDLIAFARLQEPKLDRAQRWHEALTALQARREELAGISADLRARLEGLRTELARAFAENLETVERAHRSVGRLHGRIMAITRREVEEKTRINYSKTGSMAANRKKAVSMGIAETA